MDRIKRALAALDHGDAASALRICDEDARIDPSNPFAQERETLAIRALTQLGRTIEARARANMFVAEFPDSVERPQVLRLVGNPL